MTEVQKERFINRNINSLLATMTKDAVIVLSQCITPLRELTEEARLRVDAGLEILLNREANCIIMNGGPGRFSESTEEGLYVPRGSHPVHGEVMANYAIKRGVPPEKIALQDFSGDTVGEAYFVKEMVLFPNGLHNITVVSSESQIPRAQEIYRKILGNGYQTDYIGVSIPSANISEASEHERKALEMFRSQFGHLRDGDSEAIERTLYSVHGLYKDLPPELQWKKGISPVKHIGDV